VQLGSRIEPGQTLMWRDSHQHDLFRAAHYERVATEIA
jgi:hypothetical protein